LLLKSKIIVFLQKTAAMMIPRELIKVLKNDLGKHKALVILGARQVGKTALLQTLSKDWDWVAKYHTTK